MLAVFFYWAFIIVVWYLFSFVFSLAVMPLGAFIFNRFRDRGYPFYRIIGLGVSGYLVFTATSFGLLPFTRTTIFGTLFLILLLNIVFRNKTRQMWPGLKTVIAYEVLFLAMFSFWSFVKGHEPSIRSLEKYMDFGFINSLLNSRFLPPQDPWFASTGQQFFSINYYYFGHFLTALLIKLTGTVPSVGYNLMLAFIFALATTASFSLGANLFVFLTEKSKYRRNVLIILSGILALLLVNFAGNLHTIYLFTKGYTPENPQPFWQILSSFNPRGYWYPNATRFIPFTIHEFPSYSYVVSDLHGHVLDIPFVLLAIGLFMSLLKNRDRLSDLAILIFITLTLAINYMTNSTDLLVYGTLLFFILVIKYEQARRVFLSYAAIILAALILTAPFSVYFKPFASSLGVNCAPDFLLRLGKLGPFVFEADRCQTSPFWMLALLWGFFWLNFLVFLRFIFFARLADSEQKGRSGYFVFFLFVHSILLTLFAEFFYFKDIYPAHFRANTMFKLGYQAYIMMSVLSAGTIVYMIHAFRKQAAKLKAVYFAILVPMLVLVLSYPLLSIPSYFTRDSFLTLDGSHWVKEEYPEIHEMINVLNKKKVEDGPFTILEAHGDSYTDYNVISAHTGLPTVAGWPVHEWLWRGSYEVVRPRAEEVSTVYQSDDLGRVKKILAKYNVRYVIVSDLEKQKYESLNYQKFYRIGKPIYRNNNSYLFEVAHD